MAMFNAMCTMRDIFYKYSGNDGDKNTLTKEELKNLLQKELPGFADGDKAGVNEIFTSLDSNKDGTVDFQEYMIMATSLIMLMNEFMPK